MKWNIQQKPCRWHRLLSNENKKWINAKHSSSLSIDVIQIFIFVFFFSETVFWSVFVSFLFPPPIRLWTLSASLDVVCLCLSDGSPRHAFTSQLFIITKEVMATVWTRMNEQRRQTNDRRRRRKKIYQLINWKRSFFCAVCLILKMCPITHSPRPLMPTNENLFSFPFFVCCYRKASTLASSPNASISLPYRMEIEIKSDFITSNGHSATWITFRQWALSFAYFAILSFVRISNVLRHSLVECIGRVFYKRILLQRFFVALHRMTMPRWIFMDINPSAPIIS